jgi:hypothetical protein
LHIAFVLYIVFREKIQETFCGIPAGFRSLDAVPGEAQASHRIRRNGPIRGGAA